MGINIRGQSDAGNRPPPTGDNLADAGVLGQYLQADGPLAGNNQGSSKAWMAGDFLLLPVVGRLIAFVVSAALLDDPGAVLLVASALVIGAPGA